MATDGLHDAELVRRTLAGDRGAFAALYDRYARLVRSVAGDLGPDRAEDVTQEAFLRAYRNLGTLRDPARVGPWLVGIARQVVREGRRKRPMAPLPEGVIDPRPASTDLADEADETERVLALVAALPEEERLAVQFYFLTGRSAEEAGRLLGRSRSGTYALVHKAVATLARWMGADRPTGEVRR